MKPYSKAHGGALKLSLSPSSRLRGGAAAALLAAAIPLAAGVSVAHATPNAAAKLASAARKAPNRRVVAIAQFKPGLSEAKARKIVRAHHGKITDRLPSIHGFAVKLPARQAKALRAEKLVVNVTLNTKVHNTADDSTTASLTSSDSGSGDGAASSLLTTYPTTVGADRVQAAGLTGKGIGVAVIDSGIAGDLADFKNADGSSRVTNVIANPGATTPGDDRRPRHPRRRHHRRQLEQPPGGRPGSRAPTSASPPTPTSSRSRPPTTRATRRSWT